MTADAPQLWAEHQLTTLAEDARDWIVPPYGSLAWSQLPPNDPRRYAAVIEAAEQWRRQVAEEQRLDQLADDDPAAWYAEVTAGATDAWPAASPGCAPTPNWTPPALTARRASCGPPPAGPRSPFPASRAGTCTPPPPHARWPRTSARRPGRRVGWQSGAVNDKPSAGRGLSRAAAKAAGNEGGRPGLDGTCEPSSAPEKPCSGSQFARRSGSRMVI
ncbi:DUF2742 domain-containing protein [Streptomyces sp. NPDC006530]|uniref:DUF2742 domain-containing protein n=1 Tax=Streptomyces sp. NPDC006530 TaxID=3364750 RepID=UPI00369054BB